MVCNLTLHEAHALAATVTIRGALPVFSESPILGERRAEGLNRRPRWYCAMLLVRHESRNRRRFLELHMQE